MIRRAETTPDPEDLFAETRMSFGDHLEELRLHLWRAIVGFLVAMLLSFVVGKPAMYWFIVRPVEHQLDAYYRAYKAKHVAEALAKCDKRYDQGGNDASYGNDQFSRPQLKAILT